MYTWTCRVQYYIGSLWGGSTRKRTSSSGSSNPWWASSSENRMCPRDLRNRHTPEHLKVAVAHLALQWWICLSWTRPRAPRGAPAAPLRATPSPACWWPRPAAPSAPPSPTLCCRPVCSAPSHLHPPPRWCINPNTQVNFLTFIYALLRYSFSWV